MGDVRTKRKRIVFAAGGFAIIVLARNFRYLHWYDDWKTGRRYIRRTAKILEDAYLGLGRKRAAEHVRMVTEWAVKEVM